MSVVDLCGFAGGRPHTSSGLLAGFSLRVTTLVCIANPRHLVLPVLPPVLALSSSETAFLHVTFLELPSFVQTSCFSTAV